MSEEEALSAAYEEECERRRTEEKEYERRCEEARTNRVLEAMREAGGEATMAHSKALEAYLLLEKVREIAAAIPCDAWPLEEIDDAIVGALDAVWHNAISTEDRAWLDGRKDDGAESQ